MVRKEQLCWLALVRELKFRLVKKAVREQALLTPGEKGTGTGFRGRVFHRLKTTTGECTACMILNEHNPHRPPQKLRWIQVKPASSTDLWDAI